MRVCSEPGCPELQPETRCRDHRSQRERARGTRQQRGYDAAHDALRLQWAPLVLTGNVKCWRCDEYIPPGPFDLGHDDHDRSVTRGPEHVSCNRGTSSR